MSLIFLQRLAIVAEIACPAVKLKDAERRPTRNAHFGASKAEIEGYDVCPPTNELHEREWMEGAVRRHR